MKFTYDGDTTSDIIDVVSELDIIFDDGWQFGYKQKVGYTRALMRPEVYKTKKLYEEEKVKFCETMESNMVVMAPNESMTWYIGSTYDTSLIIKKVLEKKGFKSKTYLITGKDDKFSSMMVVGKVDGRYMNLVFEPFKTKNVISIKKTEEEILKKYKNYKIQKCEFDYTGMTAVEIKRRLE